VEAGPPRPFAAAPDRDRERVWRLGALEGAAGSDTLIGGVGIDTASYAGSAAGVSVNLATGAMSGGDAAGDTLSGLEQVLGSGFADTLTGNALANTLWGMAAAMCSPAAGAAMR
jgi:Ca2+-binding RTX toxin-like protein